MPRVVKIGGAVLADAGWLGAFAAAVARAPVAASTVPHACGAARGLVVVHGGGPEIDELCARLSIPVARHGGRRVTSPEALDAAAMVLTGRVNKRIVAALVSEGVSALGLSGEDAAVVRGELAEGGALGRVGAVDAVDASLLGALLALGLVPVLSPISRGPDGAPLNINADDVAAAVAVALGAAELVFITDVAGVSDGASVRATLTPADAGALLAAGVAAGGMAVKLQAALRALEAGVASVRIGPPSALHDAAAGTRLEPVEAAA
jgi:acetylglutamate kinase